MVNGVFWRLIAKYLSNLERCQMSQAFDSKRLQVDIWQIWRFEENKKHLSHTHRRTRDASVRACIIYIIFLPNIQKQTKGEVKPLILKGLKIWHIIWQIAKLPNMRHSDHSALIAG